MNSGKFSLNVKSEPIIKITSQADIENGLEDTGRGKGKLGRSERVAWTYIHYIYIAIK